MVEKNNEKWNNLGTNLRSFRMSMNYTQEYVADLLGIEQSTYSAMEANNSDWPVSRLFKIAQIYNVSPCYFIEYSSDKPLKQNVNGNYQSGNNIRYLNQTDSKLIELYERIILLEKENSELRSRISFE
jgi:transcriptional regulator with XRE-family HTH domain